MALASAFHGRNAGRWAGTSRAHQQVPQVPDFKSATPVSSRRPNAGPGSHNLSPSLPSVGGQRLSLHEQTMNLVGSLTASFSSVEDVLCELGKQREFLVSHLDDMDASNDGTINLDELQLALRALGLAEGREAWVVAKELFRIMDDDGSGTVDRHEFFRDLLTEHSYEGNLLRKSTEFEDPHHLEELKTALLLRRRERLGTKKDRTFTAAYGKGALLARRAQAPSSDAAITTAGPSNAPKHVITLSPGPPPGTPAYASLR